MAQETVYSRSRAVTSTGVVTATLLDTVGPDRITLMLMRAAAATRIAQEADKTPLVRREIKDLIVYPFTSL